jgi:NADH-quinone oxidoreductase subunit L
MWVPLALLAILAIFSGYAFINRVSPALPEHAGEFHLNTVAAISLGALILGVLAGLALYAGKDKDPVCIPLLRNRFYIDSFYDNRLVRYFQDTLAAFIHFFDEFLINGLLVGGLTRAVVGSGNLFRKLQSGNLQSYAFSFGFGVILIIYFTVFYH